MNIKMDIKKCHKDIEIINKYDLIKEDIVNETINEIWFRIQIVFMTIITIGLFITIGYLLAQK